MPSNRLLFCVDAFSVSLLTHSGLGGVLCDHAGTWILHFQHKCYAIDPLAAEIMGMLEALIIASQRDYLYATILTNCRVAVNLLHEIETSNKYSNLLLFCRKWCARSRICKWWIASEILANMHL